MTGSLASLAPGIAWRSPMPWHRSKVHCAPPQAARGRRHPEMRHADHLAKRERGKRCVDHIRGLEDRDARRPAAETVVKLGADDAGTKRLDGNARALKLKGEKLGQGDKAGLGRDVVGPRARHLHTFRESEGRGDIDHGPRSSSHHAGQRCPRQPDRSGKIDGDLLRGDLRIEFNEEPIGAKTGVVDEKRDRRVVGDDDFQRVNILASARSPATIATSTPLGRRRVAIRRGGCRVAP